MHEWMQAVRTSRMCVSDHAAAGMLEEARRDSAEADLENARAKRSDPEKELAQIEKELEEVQAEHRQLEAEKDSAEKQLKELMARFKLRKALLHWRHRKLTLSFRSLVTMVFRTRVEEAKRLKEGSERRIFMMDAEMQKAVVDRQKAEAAKRKSDEMLTKELTLKKDGEMELRDAQRQLAADQERAEAAARRVAALQAQGAGATLGVREKDDVLRLMEEMHDLSAQTDKLTLSLKRRVGNSAAADAVAEYALCSCTALYVCSVEREALIPASYFHLESLHDTAQALHTLRDDVKSARGPADPARDAELLLDSDR
jgi:hypothetical protein